MFVIFLGMRNSHAYDRVYVGIKNPSYLFIKNVYLEASDDTKTTTEPDIPYACQGVRGFISVASDCVVEGGYDILLIILPNHIHR